MEFTQTKNQIMRQIISDAVRVDAAMSPLDLGD